MAEIKRTYSKDSPERELLPKQKTVTVDVKQVPINDIQLSEYQKPDLEEMPKSFFIIISGGEVREKDYFKIITVPDKFKRIKLEFIADPSKLTPDGMYELAGYKRARYTTSQNVDAETDEIYLISDVDHFINDLIRIKPKCEADNFHLIISNSCFEVWLYYAYRNEVPNFTVPTEILKNQSLRVKSYKKSGGQPGHEGETLLMSPNPDRIVEYWPSQKCPQCGKVNTNMYHIPVCPN